MFEEPTWKAAGMHSDGNCAFWYSPTTPLPWLNSSANFKLKMTKGCKEGAWNYRKTSKIL